MRIVMCLSNCFHISIHFFLFLNSISLITMFFLLSVNFIFQDVVDNPPVRVRCLAPRHRTSLPQMLQIPNKHARVPQSLQPCDARLTSNRYHSTSSHFGSSDFSQSALLVRAPSVSFFLSTTGMPRRGWRAQCGKRFSRVFAHPQRIGLPEKLSPSSCFFALASSRSFRRAPSHASRHFNTRFFARSMNIFVLSIRSCNGRIRAWDRAC